MYNHTEVTGQTAAQVILDFLETILRHVSAPGPAKSTRRPTRQLAEGNRRGGHASDWWIHASIRLFGQLVPEYRNPALWRLLPRYARACCCRRSG